MFVKTLFLENVRLYNKQEITFNPNTNILLGDNAQGKTTIIEALNILGLTKSHKTNKDKDIIQTKAEYAKIKALIHLKDKHIQLDIILSKLGKKAKYNQIEMEKLSDYIGQMNVVMFAPEDLDLIKGNPQNRRKFLDLEIGQISKDYLYTLQQYKKLLKQRNDLLKVMQKTKDHDYMLLDIITEQMIEYLEAIVQYRNKFIKQINEYAASNYKKLANSNDVFTISYIPSVKNNYKDEFTSKYQFDILTGTTNLGVHRDDVEFTINNEELKTYGSQGEQRTAVLATKLALVDFIYQHKQEYPIVLLDDVLSELDANRQNNLLQFINNKTQTIITTTNIKDVQLNAINQYTVFMVKNGTIKESDTNAKHI